MRKKINKFIQSITSQRLNYVINRVDYYNKLKPNSILGNNNGYNVSKTCTIADFKFTDRSLYYCDLKPLTNFFSKHLVISYIFEDIVIPPKFCSFVKSRQIIENNNSAVILKLDSFRHFNFIKHKIPYEKKKNIAVWRGCYLDHKNHNDFVKKFYQSNFVNAGDTDQNIKGTKFHKNFMTIKEQLRYKFIVSLQGYDVATNTK